MIRTPEQSRLLRWVEKHYDLDEIASVELINRNSVRLRLRGGGDFVLICRQSGEIVRKNASDLWDEVV